MNKEINKKAFYFIIFKKCIIPNLLSAGIILVYANLLGNTTLPQIISSVIGIFSMVLIAEFCISPLTCKLVHGNFSKLYSKWEKGEITDSSERTVLYLKIMKLPIAQAIHTLFFFVAGSFYVLFYFKFFPGMQMTWSRSIVVFIGCIFGTYISSLINFFIMEKVLNNSAEKLVNEGLDDEFIMERKFFGISALTRSIVFIFVPVVFFNLISILSLSQTFINVENMSQTPLQQIIRMSCILLYSIILIVVLTYLYFSSIYKSTLDLGKSLGEVYDTGSTKTKVDTSLTDVMQYSTYILNKIVKKFEGMLNLSNQVGVQVRETSEDLAVISKELTSTAMEQSADVKEILTTMEDSNAFSKNIASRVLNVSAGTENTNKDINFGFNALKEVIAQMDAVKESNIHTIEGIELLKTQVDNIGDVVTLINDIADQTKIIAFNAELEAISAGDEGRNFHIVASEIRRLANSTTNSIHEIQEYIQGIQEASEKLIASSNHVTECIGTETELSHKLEEQFIGIQQSSDLTSSKSSEISDIIAQQTSSFNQIVITLRQISAGIESFTESTKVISQASINAQEIAGELRNLTK